MRNSSSRRLGIVLGLAAGLTLAAATLSIVSARGPRSAGPSSTRGISSATEIMPGRRFVHLALAGIASDRTWIRDPLVKADADARLLVTQSINPSGVGQGVFNDHAIAVEHDGSTWAILNQDGVAIPDSAAFNVMAGEDLGAFVHEATAENLVLGTSEIDHPLTNDYPYAVLFVTPSLTQVSASTAGTDTINDHPVAVRYRPSSGRWAIANLDGTAVPVGALFNVLIATVDMGAFLHQALPANTVDHMTYIDHPLANGKPHALLFVTQNATPLAGVPGYHNDGEIGVMYVEGEGKWAILNQDLTEMPIGAGFNVAIPYTDQTFLIHESTPADTFFDTTVFSHELADYHAEALLFATSNWNAGGRPPGVYNDHPITMRRVGSKWGIRNQDLEAITEGADWNILISNVDAGVAAHEATVSNTSGTSTYIYHPLTNGLDDALVFVTPNFTPYGVETGVYNDHPIGVWYNSGEGKWAIFNQDYVNMPPGTVFNFLIPDSSTTAFVHYATALNIVSNWTSIDHPLVNDNPNAILLVTQNYNPGGVTGARNAHEIGVWYGTSSGRWAIFNQDMEPMPLGAAFNVLVSSFRIYLPLVLRSH